MKIDRQEKNKDRSLSISWYRFFCYQIRAGRKFFGSSDHYFLIADDGATEIKTSTTACGPCSYFQLLFVCYFFCSAAAAARLLHNLPRCRS